MKIISKITGGLGNQMFQYACGKAVADRLKTKLYLDLSWFKAGNREFMLNNFPNIKYSLFAQANNPLLKLLLRYIQEPGLNYWQEIEDIKSSVHLSGYWQNEIYFSNIKNIIKQDFIFPEFSCAEANNVTNKINSSSCSVCIHIRRGDYINNQATNQIHGVCLLDYYKEALQIIANKCNEIPELFLFSDDPDWVKSNFDTQGFNSNIINIPQHKDFPYHDMHLMSLCKNHIIANSTFSWWAAWLSTGDGIVVAPKRWFAEDTIKQYNPSIPSWIII